MYIPLRCVLACLSVGSAAVHGPPRLPNKGVVANNEVITRDFAIIGGGSSGTYSALRLKDLNHTVVVVEKKNVLGGHTETQAPMNYFSRFDIPLVAAVTSVPGGTTENVDLRTGSIANITSYSLAEIQAGLTAYGTQLAQYSYLEAGYYLPDDIPSDLLLPFGEFATKYNLGSVVSIIAAYGQGLGSVTDHTTLAVMKRVSLSVLDGIINGYLTAASGNHQLYDRALESLGSDVLLNSEVLLVSRSDFNKTGYVTVVVCTPTGTKTIRAKRIILTIPPKLANLGGFDLDITETSVLGQFNNSGYYTGIIGNTGLPALLSINNVSPESLFQLPEIPGVFNIVPTGLPGLFSVKYGSPNSTGLSDSYVQNDIIQALNRYQAQNNIPTTTPNFAIYSAHFPFDLTVSAEQIKAGFYKDLYALQGHNNMFYNGAAFHTYDSSALWEFTESLLPTFTAGL